MVDEDQRDVAVINRTLAERLWPGESPIGREFSYVGDPVRVIGVVARERWADVLAPPTGCVWRTKADRLGGNTVYVRLVVGCVSLVVAMVRDSVREIAIRMALGATNGRITTTVLSHGLLVTALGVALGVGAALVVVSRLADQFHAISPTHLPTFLVVPGLIVVVSTAAVGYSALTATRTDPAEHLQAE